MILAYAVGHMGSDIYDLDVTTNRPPLDPTPDETSRFNKAAMLPRSHRVGNVLSVR